MTPALLTETQTAEYLGVAVETLRSWRKRWAVDHNGPRWMKLGDSPQSGVRYRRSDLDSWIDRQTIGHRPLRIAR